MGLFSGSEAGDDFLRFALALLGGIPAILLSRKKKPKHTFGSDITVLTSNRTAPIAKAGANTYYLVEKEWDRDKAPCEVELLLASEAKALGYKDGYTDYNSEPTITVRGYKILSDAVEDAVSILNNNYENSLSYDKEQKMMAAFTKEIIRRELAAEAKDDTIPSAEV